jgi:hypothetical protein
MKSSNHPLILHRQTSDSSSTTNFPWPTSNLQSNSVNCVVAPNVFKITHRHGPRSQKTYVTWRLPSLSIGALAAAYRKHTSRDSYPLLRWRHCTCAEVSLLSRCLETDCITPLFYCCVLDLVYGAVAGQCIEQFRYNAKIWMNSIIDLSELQSFTSEVLGNTYKNLNIIEVCRANRAVHVSIYCAHKNLARCSVWKCVNISHVIGDQTYIILWRMYPLLDKDSVDKPATNTQPTIE